MHPVLLGHSFSLLGVYGGADSFYPNDSCVLKIPVGMPRLCWLVGDWADAENKNVGHLIQFELQMNTFFFF